jgi:phosphate transport system protein
LQHDIDVIRDKVVAMAALDAQALTQALEAFTKRDRQLAYAIILRDQYVDELETELDRLCLEFIVRHQPAGGHLRFVYSTSKIIRELERIGDYAESVARQVVQLSSMNVHVPTERFAEIVNQSVPMLQNAVRAFVDKNPELARTTIANEPNVRQMRDLLTADLVEWRQQNQIPLEALAPLTTVARRFERVSDQATNICEEALYFATGEYVKHRPREGFRILFVDDANACVSQMAEAIGNALHLGRLTFASAGIEAGTLAPELVPFLADKGLDIAQHQAKRLHEIPQLEQVQLIITLSPRAESAFPRVPSKTLTLAWYIPDPTRVTGAPDKVHAAYERTFTDLNNHIRDLAQAILGNTQP